MKNRLCRTKLSLRPGGGLYWGKTVESPDAIDASIDRLIVASMFYPEVMETILRLQFPLDRIEIFAESHPELPLTSINPHEVAINIPKYKKISFLRKHLLELVPEIPLSRLEFIKQLLVEKKYDEGLVLEFGVFKGESILEISKHVKKVYGFDSFEGLPVNWTPAHPAGTFSLGGVLPEVPENVELIKGWFDDTLPEFLEIHAEMIDFLHMDADLYSSTLFVLRELRQRFQKGTTILFDEFIPVQTDPALGEYAAWHDFVDEYGFTFKYVGRSGSQVAVRIGG